MKDEALRESEELAAIYQKMVPLLGAEARDLLVENPFAFLLTVDRRVRVEVMGLARRTNAGKSEIAGSTTPETQRLFPAWAGKTTPFGKSASLPAIQDRPIGKAPGRDREWQYVKN